MRVAPSMRTPLLVIHDTDDEEVRPGPSEGLVSGGAMAALHPTENILHKRILMDGGSIARAGSFVIASRRIARVAGGPDAIFRLVGAPP